MKRKACIIAIGSALLLVAASLLLQSSRPPVPMKVIQVTTNLGLYGRMIQLSDNAVCASTFREIVGVDESGRQLWRFAWPTNGSTFMHSSSLVATVDNQVISSFFDRDAKAYGLAALKDGAVRWKFLATPSYLSTDSIAIRSDGSLIFMGNREFIALDRSGVELWRHPTMTQLYSDLASNASGQLLYRDNDGTNYWLIMLEPNGREKWKVPASKQDRFSPVFSGDGSFYQAGGTNRTVAAFTSDGIERWRLNRPEYALCRPVLDSNATIYLTARTAGQNPSLLAVSPNGHLQWSFPLDWGHALTPPAIGPDGTLYLVTGDRWIRAINPDGTLKWKYQFKAKISLDVPRSWSDFVGDWQRRFGLRKNELHGPPILSSDGHLFVNFGHTGSIYVFDVGGRRSR